MPSEDELALGVLEQQSSTEANQRPAATARLCWSLKSEMLRVIVADVAKIGVQLASNNGSPGYLRGFPWPVLSMSYRLLTPFHGDNTGIPLGRPSAPEPAPPSTTRRTLL